jgi:hypothetical protein
MVCAQHVEALVAGRDSERKPRQHSPQMVYPSQTSTACGTPVYERVPVGSNSIWNVLPLFIVPNASCGRKCHQQITLPENPSHPLGWGEIPSQSRSMIGISSPTSWKYQVTGVNRTAQVHEV